MLEVASQTVNYIEQSEWGARDDGKKEIPKKQSNEITEKEFEDYMKGLYNLDYIVGYTSGGMPYGSSLEDDLFPEKDVCEKSEKDCKDEIDYDEIPF